MTTAMLFRRQQRRTSQPPIGATRLDRDAIEDLLRRGLAKAKAQGLAIRPGDFGGMVAQGRWVHNPSRGAVCPIGAVLLGASARTPVAGTAFEAMIGWDGGDVAAFIEGFDGNTAWVSERDASRLLYQLGQTLREEYVAGLDNGDPGRT